MRALTVKQPWAWAICYAGKDIENRSWKYPEALHGQRIAIHAGKSYDRDAERVVALHRELERRRGVAHDRYPADSLTHHGIVATAVLDGYCEPGEPWHIDGNHGWRLRDVRVLAEPIPINGKLGLWTLPEDIAAQIKEAPAR